METEKMRLRNSGILALVLLAAVAMGCGPTIGDPCTTSADCGNQLCLNNGKPGGYCSKSCVFGEAHACPGGTVCVRDGAGKGRPACFRGCAENRDCRAGYVCAAPKGVEQSVCVAAD